MITGASSESPYRMQNETVSQERVTTELPRPSNIAHSKYRTMLKQFWGAYWKRDNWDGAGAPQPWALARDNARLTVEQIYELRKRQLAPAGVSPMVDGGLGVVYKNSIRSVTMEFYNDGGVVTVFANGDDRRAEELADPSELQIDVLARRVQDFLGRI